MRLLGAIVQASRARPGEAGRSAAGGPGDEGGDVVLVGAVDQCARHLPVAACAAVRDRVVDEGDAGLLLGDRRNDPVEARADPADAVGGVELMTEVNPVKGLQNRVLIIRVVKATRPPCWPAAATSRSVDLCTGVGCGCKPRSAARLGAPPGQNTTVAQTYSYQLDGARRWPRPEPGQQRGITATPTVTSRYFLRVSPPAASARAAPTPPRCWCGCCRQPAGAHITRSGGDPHQQRHHAATSGTSTGSPFPGPPATPTRATANGTYTVRDHSCTPALYLPSPVRRRSGGAVAASTRCPAPA